MDFIQNGADYGDIATLFYPWRHFQSSLRRDGELPLWNRHILAGSPFLGNTESALFYPLNAPFYVLPAPFAWVLKLLLNIVIAGTATALFVRAIGGNIWGAISAGAVYALAGIMTTWQGSMIVDAEVWLPVICLGVHRMFRIRADSTAFIVTAIAFAMPMLAGHPETTAHLAVVGILYACWEAFTIRSEVGTSMRRLMIFAVAGLTAVGLSAIQILPTLEWLGLLNHTTSLDWGTLPLREGLSVFSRDIATNPNSSGLKVPESAAYAGTITLVLAPLALLHRNRREALFFLLLIVVSLSIVFGGPFHWLVNQIPVLSGLKNWRFMLIVDFSLAVLAGVGLSALTFISRLSMAPKPARLFFWIATGLACLIIGLGIWQLEHSRTTSVRWMHSPLLCAALLTIGLCLVLMRVRDRLGPRAFAAVITGLIAADIITYANGYLPSVRASQIYPTAPVLSFLQSHSASPSRIVTLDGAYGPNVEMMYGLDSVGGWDLALRRLKELMRDIAEPTLDDVWFTTARVTSIQDRRLDMLNARFFVTTPYNSSFEDLKKLPDRFSLVYSDDAVNVFENRSALPRAFLVPVAGGGIEVLPTENAQLARLRDPTFDPQRRVILSVMPPEVKTALEGEADGSRAVVEGLDVSSNAVDLTVDSDSPSILVLSQIFYPGWEVLVDGSKAPILQPNYALTGVFVNKGPHSIQFVYRPASLRIGMAITLSTILIAVVITLAATRRAARTAASVGAQTTPLETL